MSGPLNLEPGAATFHEQPQWESARQEEGPAQQEMVEDSLFCLGWQGNTSDKMLRVQTESLKILGCGEDVAKLYNQIGSVGQARAWEKERDSCREGNYGLAFGWGCVTRIQRLTNRVICTPIAASSIVVGTAVCSCELITAVSCAALTAGTCGCSRDRCEPAALCFEASYYSASSVAMMICSLAYDSLCLPCNVVCPEALDSLGQHKIYLAQAEMMHRINVEMHN